MRRGLAHTRHGQVHYVFEGSGDAVLLLHQTPRSWDEYRDVIPLLAEDRFVVAVDTLGFGCSDSPDVPWTIELFANGIVDLVEDLGLERCDLVGHHTGGVVALEVAASHPERVRKLVLSGVPFVDEERRDRVSRRTPIDGVPMSDDGTHFKALWEKRTGFYPPNRPDLLHRLMVDAVRLGPRVEEGHIAVNSYRMEDRTGLVRAETLVVCGELDGFSMPDVPRLLDALEGSRAAILPGLGVAAVDEGPEIFASVVGDFLRGPMGD